jgi:hypothetical protein
MDRRPTKIALAVILGLSMLSGMPIRLGKQLPDLKLPATPPLPSTARVDPPYRYGRIACRASTGEFLGMVVSTFDGTRWTHTFVNVGPPSKLSGSYTIETFKAGKSQPDEQQSGAQPEKPEKRPAQMPDSDYFLTFGKCPDGQPASSSDRDRWNRSPVFSCTPELPHTRNVATDPRCPPQVVR